MVRLGLEQMYPRRCSASGEPRVRWEWVFDEDRVGRDAERAGLALDCCVPCWVANWRRFVADAPEEPKMTELVAAVAIVDENVT